MCLLTYGFVIHVLHNCNVLFVSFMYIDILSTDIINNYSCLVQIGQSTNKKQNNSGNVYFFIK
jgi:hypothetical protein